MKLPSRIIVPVAALAAQLLWPTAASPAANDVLSPRALTLIPASSEI